MAKGTEIPSRALNWLLALLILATGLPILQSPLGRPVLQLFYIAVFGWLIHTAVMRRYKHYGWISFAMAMMVIVSLGFMVMDEFAEVPAEGYLWALAAALALGLSFYLPWRFGRVKEN
ncbi:MAG: hypothetical protein ACLFS0_08295 [Bacteroidales bacterium]